MEKIKSFLPTIIIILVSSVFIVKNSGFISSDDNYVVSEAEDKNINNEKYVNNNQMNYDTNTNLNESIKDSNLDSLQKLKNDESIKKKITIYISGAVKSPKVVELDSEDRLMDGVMLCDGVSDDADMNKINMAMKVEDGGHYIIPKIGDETVNNNESTNYQNSETKNKDLSVSNNNNSSSDNNKININNASLAELDSLPGVGEITAQKIIDYREENTKFKSIEEIKNVKGIGENKFNNLKDYICIQ